MAAAAPPPAEARARFRGVEAVRNPSWRGTQPRCRSRDRRLLLHCQKREKWPRTDPLSHSLAPGGGGGQTSPKAAPFLPSPYFVMQLMFQ